jgi:phosphatidate cytidylyltransferase
MVGGRVRDRGAASGAYLAEWEMTGDEVVDQSRMVGGRHLPTAIAVGVVLAVLFLGSLFWRSEAFAGVIAVLAATAYVDAARVLKPVGVRLLTPVLILTSVVMMAAAHEFGPSGQAAGITLLVAGSVVTLLIDAARRDVMRTLAITVLFGLWVAFLASFGVLLIVQQDGVVIVLAVVGSAIFTDIGGYAFGVTLGRHKVAPSVSPNKSWEGLIGGLVVTAVLAAFVLPLFGDTFTAVTAAVLAVTCGLASFVGDLTESMIKRDLGVKDLGDLLPGHGGLLDRVDSILFALPMGYYAVSLFA